MTATAAAIATVVVATGSVRFTLLPHGQLASLLASLLARATGRATSNFSRGSSWQQGVRLLRSGTQVIEAMGPTGGANSRSRIPFRFLVLIVALPSLSTQLRSRAATTADAA